MYQQRGRVMVRATTIPDDLDAHLTNNIWPHQQNHQWVEELWSRSDVREAIREASPDLARRLDQHLAANTQRETRDIQRAARSLSSYLMRWQRRTTPFGWFAGVAQAEIGAAKVKVGHAHVPLVRVDASWLGTLVDHIERDTRLWKRCRVTIDNAGFVRNGRFIVIEREKSDSRTVGPVREVSIRLTPAVEAVQELAASPISFQELAEHLVSRFEGRSVEAIRRFLGTLVSRRVVITSFRPPMSTVDPLSHVIRALRTTGGDQYSDIRQLIEKLDSIRNLIARHNDSHDFAQAAVLREAVRKQMNSLQPENKHPLAVDMRLDAAITIPPNVIEEAQRAANVLLRLTTKPFGTAAWLDYHSRFRARYGAGTLVPVRDLVSDAGLGFPTGYLGAPRARPAWRTITERDAALLALVQRVALEGVEEIALTDADLKALTISDANDVVPPEHVELGFSLLATSLNALNAGDFQLRVTAAPRSHTSMAGRFSYLFDTDDGSNEPRDDVIEAQMSYPPRAPHNENVTRVGRSLSQVISLWEYTELDVIRIDDLAVTADDSQMYLIQQSTGKRVEPRTLNALDTTVQSLPLARFIVEVATARSAVFGPFDLGVCRTLPYVPRIRYQRTILSPARWSLALKDVQGDAQDSWRDRLDVWRRRWRVPARIIASNGELRLPLNLDEQVDRDVLHERLIRAEKLEILEDIPITSDGWIGRPAEILLALKATNPSKRALPRTADAATSNRPGISDVIHMRLVGNPARFDELISKHLPGLASDLNLRRWWIRRHRNMIHLDTDQHIAACFRLVDAQDFSHAITAIGRWAQQLEQRGLPAQISFDAHHEHLARYGGYLTRSAAEELFAADTAAAITQLQVETVPPQALAAVSLAHLAASFANSNKAGLQDLIHTIPHGGGVADRQTCTIAKTLVHNSSLLAIPGGTYVADAWNAREIVARNYFYELGRSHDGLMPTLLRDHLRRAIGVEKKMEKDVLQMARAVAQYRLATGETS